MDLAFLLPWVIGTAALSAVFGMAGGMVLLLALTSRMPLAEAMVLHGALLVRTGGRPSRLGWHQHALVLETVGRRSGMPRPVPLLTMRHGGDFVVLASNYGQEHPPAWWLNLEANPNATVRLAHQRSRPVCARVATGDERDRDAHHRIVDRERADDAGHAERDDDAPERGAPAGPRTLASSTASHSTNHRRLSRSHSADQFRHHGVGLDWPNSLPRGTGGSRQRRSLPHYVRARRWELAD